MVRSADGSIMLDLRINTDDLDAEKNISGAAKEAAEGFNDLGTGLDHLNSKWDVFVGSLLSSAVQSAFSMIVDLGKGIIQTGVDFSASMSRVQAISGATAEEFELLEDTARQLGAETVFSASDAAEALNYMALSGWDVQQSVEGIPGVLNLAAASGMGLAQASSLVTDNIAAFGLEAKDAAYFADMLAYAQSHSNTTAEQLGEAYRLSAANLSSAGQSVQTVTALLGAMADQGLKGSESGTALAAVMRDLTAKMEDGAIAIGDTSIEVMDANGNYHDLIDIMKDVESATDGMGDAQRATALANTFTADSIRGVNLILNRGVDYVADYRKELENATGTAETMSEVMTDNVAGDIDELSSAWEEFGLKLYEYAEEPMRDVIQWATNELIPSLESAVAWVADNADTIINIIQGVATGLAAYTVGLGAYKAAALAAEIATKGFMVALNLNPITLVIGGIAALVGLFMALHEQGQDAADDFIMMSEEAKEANDYLRELTETRKELNDASKENVTNIDAEAQHSEALWEELQKITDENGKIKDGYLSRAQALAGTLTEATGVEIEIVDGQIQKYGELCESIEQVIATKRAEAVLDAYKDSYTNAIQEQTKAQEALATAISEKNRLEREGAQWMEAAQQIQDAQISGNYELINQLENELGMSYAEITNMANHYSEAIAAQEGVIRDNASTVDELTTTIGNYENMLGAVSSGSIPEMQAAQMALTEGLKLATSATKEQLVQQVNNYKESYQQMLQEQQNGNTAITDDMLAAEEQKYNIALAELNKRNDVYRQKVNERLDYMANTEGPMSEQIADANVDAMNIAYNNLDLDTPVEREFSEILSDMEVGGSDSISSIAGTVNNIVGTVESTDISGPMSIEMGQYAQAIYDGGRRASSEASSMASSVRSNAQVSLYSTGYNAAVGMGQGIYDGRSYVSSAAAFIANSALSMANSILGIRSPSRVFAEVGKYIDQGLAGGIDDNTSLVTDTIADQLEDVIGMYDDLTIPAHFSASYSGIPDPPGIAMGTVLPTQIALQNARIGASSNALSSASGTSGSGNLVLRVYLSGKQIYEEIVKQDVKERISTGRSGLGNV